MFAMSLFFLLLLMMMMSLAYLNSAASFLFTILLSNLTHFWKKEFFWSFSSLNWFNAPTIFSFSSFSLDLIKQTFFLLFSMFIFSMFWPVKCHKEKMRRRRRRKEREREKETIICLWSMFKFDLSLNALTMLFADHGPVKDVCTWINYWQGYIFFCIFLLRLHWLIFSNSNYLSWPCISPRMSVLFNFLLFLLFLCNLILSLIYSW